MKQQLCWALILMGTSRMAVAQTDSLRRPVYVGLDVLQNGQALLTSSGVTTSGGQAYFRRYANVEPTLLVGLNKPKRYWRLTVGYTAFTSNKTQRNILLDDRGFYLKTGLERSYDWLGLGWAVTGHVWQSRDRFTFAGPYFGDYTGYIVNPSQVALGIEGYLRQYVRLGGRFGLRFIERLNVLTPLQFNLGNTFIPGVGPVTRGAVKFGAGATMQLLYRLQPNRLPRRSAVNESY